MAGSWLLVTWAGGGNVGPFLGLAEQLVARGHRVGALATRSLIPRLAAVGAETTGPAEGSLPTASDVARTAGAFDPDVLVVDYMLTGALCAAEKCGQPTVALVHTLYTALLVEGAPQPIRMAAPLESLNELRRSIGLGPISGFADLLAATDVVLVTAPRQLDAPGAVPPNLVYAGAILPGPGSDVDWRPPSGEGPLVVVSLGTAGEAAPESELLRKILDALGGLPVRGLVNLPDYIDAATLRPPANVTLSGYVRHTAVLPRADLLVTHAGLGSVLAALAFGVPMVCLPLGREQPDNAEAVVRVGAGRTLSAASGPEEIREAISAELGSGRSVRIEPDPGPVIAALEGLIPRAA